MALTADDIDRMTDPKGKAPAEDAPVDRGDDFAPTGEDEETQGTVETETGEETTGEETTGEETTGEEEAPARGAKGRFIPKARFDEMSMRSRQAIERAHARISELEGQVASNQEFKLEEVDAELDKLETQYMALLVDGKTDEALKMRAQIRDIERRYASAQAAAVATGTREQLVDSVKLDDVITQLEETFPFLDPNNEEFSKEIADEILDLHEGLVAKGWSQSIAMQRAASYVLNTLDIEWEGEEATEETGEEETQTETTETRARTDQERRAAVKRGLEAITRQPPVATGKTGETGAPRQVTGKQASRMSMKEFEKLSPEALKQLRGDDFVPDES
jgi:hypothetical protein